MRLTVHLRGVGGQSLPFVVSMLGRRAAAANLRVSGREVVGMAQRGGSVSAVLDLEADAAPGGEPSFGGTVLLGLELLEGLRGFAVLRPGEPAFVATGRLVPPGTWRDGRAAYPTPEQVVEVAARHDIRLTLVDAPTSAPWKVVQAAIDRRIIPLEEGPRR